MKISGFFFSLFLLIGTQTIFAGGFQIPEQGGRAVAMGGAFTAIAWDPSAIYYNNAAITRLDGFQALIGTTMIVPSSSFRGPYGPGVSSPTIHQNDMAKQTFFPSHAYATYKVSNDWYVGLGFNTPFGLGTKWDPTWDGRFVSNEIELKTFSFNPVVAYKINDMLSIGAGFQYNIGTVTIDRAAGIADSKTGVPYSSGEGAVHLEGNTKSAVGYTIGGLANLTKDFSLGVSFRSEVKYNFKGTASSTGPAQFISVLPHGNITAVLKSPAQLVIGAGYHINEQLLVSADFQYVWWSSYDTLKVTFDDGIQNPIAKPRSYKNAYVGRVGAEYNYSPSLALRGGLLYDQSPVEDEYVDASLPEANRLGFSLGFGYKFNDKLGLDLAWLFLRFAERTVTTSQVSFSKSGFEPFNGTYNSSANLVSLSLSYKF